jgi:preprotein translocase subunit YajC
MFQPFFPLPLADLDTAVTGAAPAAAPPAERPAVAAANGAAGVPAAAVAATNTAGATASTSQPGTATAPGADGKRPPSAFDPMSLVWIVLMVVVLYFFLFRGQRKTEQKRKLMLNEMKKGDRVMTIGGLIARVVSIDGDEVVLKVDESANVKATYSKKAIQEVLNQDEKK